MKGRKPNPNRPHYATMISEARTAKGWTQAQLGEAVGKDVVTIKKYESGSRIPPFDSLSAVCKALDIDIRDVMNLDLRHGDSGTYKNFIETPYQEILSLINDDIDIFPVTDAGYTDNDVSIIHNNKEAITTKTDLILKVADIKDRLKADYRKKLTEAVNDLVINIVNK
jgi:transcriptional regulator with XRE-family HTH domain